MFVDDELHLTFHQHEGDEKKNTFTFLGELFL